MHNVNNNLEAASLSITEAALQKIQEIKKPAEAFRIKIEPGGCNGFEYYFSIEAYPQGSLKKTERQQSSVDNASGDFMIFHNNQPIVIVDNISLGLLKGSVLDYETELIGEKFIIKNPNSKSSCSCGASFGL